MTSHVARAPVEIDVAGGTDPPAPRPATDPVLARRVRRGSAIELLGFGSSQVMRLVTNLVMSRMLFPEAYGLTAIATVFMVALHMLTDVGLRDSIMNNPRGDDERFLNTAWTIQVVRGGVLWLVAAATAWPLAQVYGEPQLFGIIVASSFVSVLYGFQSTAPSTLSRHLRRGALLKVEIASKVISMSVMFVWAWLSPSVWALVAGALVQALSELVLTHTVLPVGYRNRFHWDRDAAREIARFGRWIFGSSTFGFLAEEGDRLLLGRLLSMATLGVYSVASLLASGVLLAVRRLSSSVMYGMLSTVAREQPSELSRHYYAARLRVDLLALPVVGSLIVLGPAVVQVMYDDRYATAGWMLQVLSVRVALACVNSVAGVCLLTLNRPQYFLPANAGRFVFAWGGILVGYAVAGTQGVISAIALSELPVLVTFLVGMRRAQVLRPKRELLAIVGVTVGIAVGFLVRAALSSIFPELSV